MPDRKHRYINVLFAVLLLIVVLPLLVLGIYNFPSADDWSHATLSREAVLNGKSIFVAAFKTALDSWHNVDAKFMNPFWVALRPGIVNERGYILTVPLILLIFIAGHYYAFGTFFSFLSDNDKGIKKVCFPIATACIASEILFCADGTEGFFWFPGAFNYSAMFSMALVLAAITAKLAFCDTGKIKRILLLIAGGFLAFAIGGNSFSCSVPTFCIVTSFELWFIVAIVADKNNRKKWAGRFARTIHIWLLLVLGISLVVLSPAAASRLSGSFGGSKMGVFAAVGVSIWRTLLLIYSYLIGMHQLPMIIVTIPFSVMFAGKVTFRFRLPVLFSIYTMLVCASVSTVNILVDDSFGGGRLLNVASFALTIWFCINTFYWTGWFVKRDFVHALAGKKAVKIAGLVLLCAVMVLSLAKIVSARENVCTYRACVALVKGEGKEYARRWEERLEVLNDPDIKECYFEPIQKEYSNLCYYCDFIKGGNWVNVACQYFYDKDLVDIE